VLRGVWLVAGRASNIVTSSNRLQQSPTPRLILVPFALLGMYLPAAASDSWLNFHGQTGLIEIPDAQTIPSQEILFHANNNFQAEERQIDDAQNYIFGYGLLPGLELSGRLAVAEDEIGERFRNDLSGNAKWRFLDFEHFDLAVGIQDFGGDAQNFEARYGVGTAQLGPLDLTLGYGVGPDRLDGAFGGVAVDVGRWGRIAIDHDGDAARAGLGLRYQFLDRAEAEFSTKLYSENDDEDLAFGLSLRFALGKPAPPIESPRIDLPRPVSVDNTRTAPAKNSVSSGNSPVAHDSVTTVIPSEARNLDPVLCDDLTRKTSRCTRNDKLLIAGLADAVHYPRQASATGTNEQTAQSAPDTGHSRGASTDDTPQQTAQTISDALTDAGFSRVRVGEDSAGRTVVKFENRRFWHSQLDGFQVVHQVLRRLDVDATGWVLAEEKNGVPRSTVLLDESLQLQRAAHGAQGIADVQWLTDESTSPFGVELRLEPRLDTLVGTDFGVFDYDLALQSTLNVLLGHGLSIHGGAVVDVARSDTYEDGGAFENRQQDDLLDEAFLQWTHRPHPAYLGRVSGGIQRLRDDDFTVLDYEGALHSPTGAHQLHAHLAHFDNQDSDDNRDLAIGSYRYWWWDRDISVTLSAGQFFDEKLGGRVILRRYIGDAVVGLFYLRDEDGEQAGGLSLSFPLTPRVGMKPIGGFYIVGQPRWQYAISTTIDGPDGRNVLRPDFLSEPDPNYNLRRDFLDSDRALPGYMETHWRRGIYGDQIEDAVE
jgi:hypothetical protein